MAQSKIEWTEKVWNPVTGCDKVSQGCKHCYAEGVAKRFWDTQYAKEFPNGRKFTDVMIHQDRLEIPLHWKKPSMIFVNSMSDLFHEDVPDVFIQNIFSIIENCKRHTFQILTKRPERMMKWVNEFDKWLQYAASISFADKLPNVWLGVSVENQETADERIPILLQTPAAVRWLSCEPLLGEVDLKKYLNNKVDFFLDYANIKENKPLKTGINVDWVVVGGESGQGARPMHPDWARKLQADCSNGCIPFFFKQWGEWVTYDEMPKEEKRLLRAGESNWKITHIKFDNDGRVHTVHKTGKHRAGRLLDGIEYNEYPKIERKE